MISWAGVHSPGVRRRDLESGEGIGSFLGFGTRRLVLDRPESVALKSIHRAKARDSSEYSEDMERLQVYAASALIGFVAGLRSMTAPAIVSGAIRSGALPLPEGLLSAMGSPACANTFAGLAVGELIADKTPRIPSRTDPGPLVARLVSGGLCGAAICCAKREPMIPGAALGALASIGGAFLGYHLRRDAVRNGSLPDFGVALVEDAVALGAGLAAIASLRQSAGELA